MRCRLSYVREPASTQGGGNVFLVEPGAARGARDGTRRASLDLEGVKWGRLPERHGAASPARRWAATGKMPSVAPLLPDNATTAFWQRERSWNVGSRCKVALGSLGRGKD